MPVEPQPPSARGLLKPGAPPAYFSAALAGLEGIRHAFFGREGGVSTGIYTSLNAGPGSKDAPEAVTENRRRIASALDVAPDHLVGVHQIHSALAFAATGPWPGARPEGDGLATSAPELALSILTADCAPVLFADPEARVIGAAHAGWKGALTGVLEAALTRMEEAGAKRARIVAAIGPCIHQASYDVGPEFEARFLEISPGYARFFVAGDGDRRRFDLPGFCAARLRAQNIASVDVMMHDTYAEPDALFSHRRSVHENAGDYGRNCATIVLAD